MFYVLAIISFILIRISIDIVSEPDIVSRVIGAIMFVVGAVLAASAYLIA